MKKQCFLPLAALFLSTFFSAPSAFAQADDMDPCNQRCSEAIATAVVDYWRAHIVEERWSRSEGIWPSRCKINPADPAQTIVVIGPDGERDETNWTELAIINTATHQVIATGDAQLVGGGPEAAGIFAERIDTARYNLASGVRAFGLHAQEDYSPNCGDGSVGPSLYLYVREGRRIRLVLKGLHLSELTLIQRGNDRCGGEIAPHTPGIVGTTHIFIAVASSSSHGYHDLRITADCSRDPPLDDGNHVRAIAPSHLLHYNGKEYPIKREGDWVCEDRWSIAAVVTKTTKGTPVIINISSQTFLPSTPVQIVAREPARVLVQKLSGESWWLPPDAIVESSAFKRVHAWHGPATFEGDSADGGNGTIYHFRLDGSYTFDYHDSNGTSQHAAGYLWEYASIIAAGSNHSPVGAYFWRQQDGSLCDADLDGCPLP